MSITTTPFSELLDRLTPELVESWWATAQQPETYASNDRRRRYALEKNGKQLPFRFTIKELAKKVDIAPPKTITTDKNRNSFAEAFGFRIVENLVYSGTEQVELANYLTRAQRDELLTQWVRHCQQEIERLQIDPYFIRMAISGQRLIAELGKRNVFTFRPHPEGSEIGFITTDQRFNSDDNDRVRAKAWSGANGRSLTHFIVSSWDELPEGLMEDHRKALETEYQFIQSQKLHQIRQGSGTSNFALKYMLMSGQPAKELMMHHLFTEDETDETPKQPAMKTHPLNTILYGPPGTGKTYQTINRALSIIENKPLEALDKENRKELLARYRDYVAKQQVAFVTFHQSLGYEDFVEGIKPKTHADGVSVTYDVEPGIFRQMVDNAKGGSKSAEGKQVSLPEKTLENASFWKMSLGNTAVAEEEDTYRYCIKHNCVAMGWGGSIDFTGAKTEADVVELMREAEELKAEGWDYQLVAVKYLRLGMQTGDVVIVSNGNRYVRAIGMVDGDYFFDADAPIGCKQFRKVKWLYTDLELLAANVYERGLSQMTLYSMTTKAIRKDFFKASAAPTNNHVLIIDEINRGNVSATFGELITLIEPSKRSEADEALSLTLPYSSNSFSVPANLYLIGTMNTADRSVEALDTALRRRFSFVECGPRPELLTPAAMIHRLLWKYKDVKWEDKEYAEKEATLFELLGASEAYKTTRKFADWDKMEKEKAPDPAQLTYINTSDFTGLDLEKLLTTLNHRIEALLSKDHCLGHSFFMQVWSWDVLQTVFANSIVPLLEEHFFGNPVQLSMVLGTAFFEPVSTGVVAFATATFPSDHEAEPMYRLKNVHAIKNFKEAIFALLPAKDG